MIELTKAEEQVMQFLWKLEKAFLKDIVENYSEPKPASTTVATVIRVLIKKGFIGFNTYGKINEYFPLISKDDYFRKHFKKVAKNFFNGSSSKIASFFTDDKDVNLSELEEMKQMIEERIKKLKENNE
ncbi:MAG: BlaI/MecI/CopY family transcriptional regulator [Bacteroidales bacterium]|nr:BlaI/MecI/CopY family transcriptional regulator [Bacteroidales bacterium]